MTINGAKSRILDAAEQLISEKGITGTTIAKIARRAEVVDSHIYLYFKGKDDLLFAVAHERMKEAYEQIDAQLQGIRDAASRLSRLVWHSLNYNDHHPGYVRILFDCFTKKQFYETPAYRQGKKIAQVVLDILEQGVEQGVFRPDINMRLVQLTILGTFDIEAIGQIMTGETEATSQDLDDIMDLIYPMITVKTPSEKANKRDQILKCAQQVFARNGYAKTKISKIAETADVGEATIYDYFKNKQDLLLSIPGNRLNATQNLLQDLFYIKTSSQKLRRFLEYHFWLFASDPDFRTVFISDIQFNKNFFVAKYSKTYQQYFRQLDKILEQGKKEGSFRKELNPRVFRNMFLGAFSRITLRWVIFGDTHAFDRFSEANQCIELFTTAVQNTE
jgi:TetR/AcrR family fatty acid metabolism transcriptional regulator